MPPFARIRTEHFKPAFEVALAEHLEEVKGIATCSDAPAFENTILPFDRCGGLLNKVNKVFDNLCLSNSPPELQQVQLDMAAPLAAHESKVYNYPGLFTRIDAVFNSRFNLGLNDEQIRLVERFHLDFVRAGARFNTATQVRYSELMEKLAELTTKFTQNVMADESEYTIVLAESDLAGCPPDLIAATRQAGIDRSLPDGSHVITLSRSLVVPFLTTCDRRGLRERVWRAWTSRGELNGKRDNKAVAVEILKLRVEQARLHGYASFGEFQTADTMAKTPGAVMELLERAWLPAKQSAERERQALQDYAAATAAANAATACPGDEGGAGAAEGSSGIQPWDWRYYAEKVRQSRYDFDESTLKPYFPLERMTGAIFDVAHRLFGLRFVHRPDIRAYHPDVAVYEVREMVGEEDKLVAIFMADNYCRPNKASGAWMSDYRAQSRNPSDGAFGERVVPIIVNNNNFVKGEPTLLSFDDAVTLFHEFGHGCHGMLSDVTYQRLAGTSVLRDFVELPSQLMEHWFRQRPVLLAHARHAETGEPLPEALLDRLFAARKFNQGFECVEYTACALLDQALHALDEAAVGQLNLDDFEAAQLLRLGMPKGIVLRHRLPHFQHLFSSSAYASAYYVYLWAEVLDADGFDAFLESGDIFDAATAQRVRRFIYSSGNSLEPGAAFRAFRGRDPSVEPMLKKKGLL